MTVATPDAYAESLGGSRRSLILDLFGAYSRSVGNWIAISDVIALMGDLGVDEQSVRSAVSRMARQGLLLKERRNGASGYALAERTIPMLERGDRRIFSSMEPAKLEDGWVLVAFSVPEAERDKRYQLRKRLKWLGFGDLGNGVYIAPRRGVDELAATLADVGLSAYVDVFEGHYAGFDEVKDVVARAWDLAALRALYSDFLDECAPVVRRWARAAKAGDRQAFIDYTLTVHRWRKFPYLDPGLPVELLPAGWQGNKSAQTFANIRRKLERPAHKYVRHTVNGKA